MNITKLDFYIALAVFAIAAIVFIKCEYYDLKPKKDFTDKGMVVTILPDTDYSTTGYVLYRVKDKYCIRYKIDNGTWKTCDFYEWEITFE